MRCNPVYQQFMRLSQFYEDDELRKRQDEIRAYAARMGDPRLGTGFIPPRGTDPGPAPEPRGRSRSRAGLGPVEVLGRAKRPFLGPKPTNIQLGDNDPETEGEEYHDAADWEAEMRGLE